MDILNLLISNGILDLVLAILGIMGATYLKRLSKTQGVKNFKEQYGAVYNVAETLVKAAEQKSISILHDFTKKDRYKYVREHLTKVVLDKANGIDPHLFNSQMLDSLIEQIVLELKLEEEEELPDEPIPQAPDPKVPDIQYARPSSPIPRGGRT